MLSQVRQFWSNQSLRPSAPRLGRGGVCTPCWHLAPALLLALLPTGGCQTQHRVRPADPRQLLTSYQRSIAQNNPQLAYELLTPDLQTALPRDVFTTLWGSTQGERADQRAQLAALGSQPDRPELAAAKLTRLLRVNISGEGLVRSELQLAADPGGAWRITTPELSPTATATPEAALHGLLEALDRRSLALLLRLLRPATRQAVEDELNERAERLRAALAGRLTHPSPPGSPTPSAPTTSPSPSPLQLPHLELVGDRARLQYDPRFFIELVRDKDGWRIRDMN